MNKKLAAISVLCVLVTAAHVVAQQRTAASFAELDRALKEEASGWAGDKGRLSSVFDVERKQLGDKFEFELMKYIGDDAEKHYWISLFLEEPSYLHGNKPLPELALSIKQQGISLLKDKHDEESLGLALGLNVTAAVLSETLGHSSLAVFYKGEAERLLSANRSLSNYFPAMSEPEERIYAQLKSGNYPTIRSSSPITKFPDEPKTRVSGGVLNGRATHLAIIGYPAAARKAGASGEVTVKIVVDETGKVIWARVVSGHELLRKEVLKAAYQARFPPKIVSGKPEMVSGLLIYRFVLPR
jgi:TonB family protein